MTIFDKIKNNKNNEKKKRIEENAQFKQSKSIFEDGLRILKLKEYKAAIKEFNIALKSNPSKDSNLQFDILYNLGLSYFYMDHFKDAISYFNKAIKLDNKGKNNAFYYKGISLLKLKKDLGNVLDCFCKAIEINDNDIDSWYMKGCVENDLGEVKEAAKSFDNVFKMNSNFENYYECPLFDEMKDEKGVPEKEEESEEEPDLIEETKKEKEYKTKVGFKVKDIKEFIIANFLFDNDIKFQYKPLVVWAEQHFEPLFYLPKFDVYLEHFDNPEEDEARIRIDTFEKHNKNLIYTTPEHEEDLSGALKIKLTEHVSSLKK